MGEEWLEEWAKEQEEKYDELDQLVEDGKLDLDDTEVDILKFNMTTPKFHYDKDKDREKNTQLAILLDLLGKKDGEKYFVDWVEQQELEWRDPAMKSDEVARRLDEENRRDAIRYLKRRLD